mgnify:FL=1
MRASSAAPRQGSLASAIGAGLRSTSSRECPGWHRDIETRGNPGHESPTRHGRGLGSAARTWARRQAGYPEDYDEDEGVGAHLGERRQTSRVRRSPTPRRPRMGEIGGGDESPWPTIGASVGPGTTAEAGRGPLVGHARGTDRRLGYHRGDARSAPRARDLDHTPYHADGSAIERVLVQDSHRSPICSKQLDRIHHDKDAIEKRFGDTRGLLDFRTPHVSAEGTLAGKLLVALVPAAWQRRRMHESGLDRDHAPRGLLDEAGVTGRHARESHRPRVCEITGRQRNIFDKLGYGWPATS